MASNVEGEIKAEVTGLRHGDYSNRIRLLLYI